MSHFISSFFVVFKIVSFFSPLLLVLFVSLLCFVILLFFFVFASLLIFFSLRFTVDPSFFFVSVWVAFLYYRNVYPHGGPRGV